MNITQKVIAVYLPVLFLAIACAKSVSPDSGSASAIGDTSENSLDWAGVYTGNNTLVTLSVDHRYTYEERISPDSLYKAAGIFSWDNSGRNIRLSGMEKTFWVREGNIAPLNKKNKVEESAVLAKEEPAFENTYWQLTEINGKPVEQSASSPGRNAHLRFHNAEKRISGSSGCNRIMGSYEATEEKLQLGQLGSTMMACPSMELEQEFTQTIERVALHRIENGSLILSDKEDRPLFKFSRTLAYD